VRPKNCLRSMERN